MARLFPKIIKFHHQIFHFSLSHLWKQHVKKRVNLTNIVNIISNLKIYKYEDLKACCVV